MANLLNEPRAERSGTGFFSCLSERGPRRALVIGAYRLWTDVRGQDMIEYALLAAALAIVVAGFLPPTIMPSVTVIFSKVVSGFNAS
jgi:Flp pilus assembly pilin Flp